MAISKLKKDTLIKIGIVAVIALVVFFVYRSKRRSGFEGDHMQWVPTPNDNYGEEAYDYGEDDYAEEPEDEYAEEPEEEYAEEDEYPQDDYEAEYVEDDYGAEYDDGTGTGGLGLMESTMDDDYANTMFKPSG